VRAHGITSKKKCGYSMNREYTISEDKDYKEGNGVKAYIKDGKFICDVVDECGNAGGEWFCDIELLRYHIERYKQGLTKK